MRNFNIIAIFLVFFVSLVGITMKMENSNKESTYGECNKENETVSQSHKDYVFNYGWNIESTCYSITEKVSYNLGLIDFLKGAGLDLTPYNNMGKEALITTYTLMEKQSNGDKLSATIYEIDGKIIGGIGSKENWEPGMFSLSDKKEIVDPE